MFKLCSSPEINGQPQYIWFLGMNEYLREPIFLYQHSCYLTCIEKLPQCWLDTASPWMHRPSRGSWPVSCRASVWTYLRSSRCSLRSRQPWQNMVNCVLADWIIQNVVISYNGIEASLNVSRPNEKNAFHFNLCIYHKPISIDNRRRQYVNVFTRN